MAKSISVEEALNEIKAKYNAKGEILINRFNKKKFETLLLAMANDTSVKSSVIKYRNGEITIEDNEVTKGFRKFCKKLLESAGMDKLESSKVESPDFVISSIDGLYDFFTEAMYLYMEAGNQFDLPPKKDFKGGIRLIDVPESTKVYNSGDINKTGKNNKIEKKTKKHKKLKAKSSAPSYLSEKRLVK